MAAHTLTMTMAEARQGDRDKLALLEKLIIAQKDAHLKRELAAEAARALDIIAVDVEA
jgi:hypothetical protein